VNTTEIHCHDAEKAQYPAGPLTDAPVVWYDRGEYETDGNPRCSWCGSVHPDVLMAEIAGKARHDYTAKNQQLDAMRGTSTEDEFFAALRDAHTPGDGEVYIEYADWKYGWPHKIYFGAGHLKFYTRHLTELDDARFAEVAAEIMRLLPEVQWFRDERGTGWRKGR